LVGYFSLIDVSEAWIVKQNDAWPFGLYLWKIVRKAR
jgi:hypothetical protein